MRPRVYVGGTFDLFHPGHVELLRRADKLGDVWVALNSDDYAEELKGKRPIMSYGERATMLLACEYVKEVVCNDHSEYELLTLVRPRVIYYGSDGSYTRQSYLDLFGVNEAYLDANGIDLIFPKRTKGVSSTDIVERILQRHRGEPRQPGGSPEDAGQPHVPDPEAGRDACLCQRDSDSGCCRTKGRLSSRGVPCS